MERSYIGISQRRRGPNKISLWGILQPILDGLKLIIKSATKSHRLNFILFSFVPIISLLLFILFWSVLPYIYQILNFSLGGLFLIVLLGIIGFNIIITGWASNNKFALFGSLRSITQSISYEIVLSLIILRVFCIKTTLNPYLTQEGFHTLETLYSCFILIPVAIIILAECGRTPFDLLEAERELVRGYNVEYSRIEFAFLFIAEYGIIIILSIVFALLLTPLLSRLASFFIITRILFLRYTLPRLRYDFLISIIWKSLLPATILLWVAIFNSSIA